MQVDGIEKGGFIWDSILYKLYCTQECRSLVQEMFQGNISVPASAQLPVFSLGLKEVLTVPLSNPAQGTTIFNFEFGTIREEGCIVHRVNFHLQQRLA